jgi:enoyl-CoA hydratase
MTIDILNVTLKDDILVIEINRPEKLNALNLKTVDEIEFVIHEAYSDPLIKGIIITGAGNKAFVAGADIKEFSAFTPEQGREMVIKGQRALKLIEDSPKPVVAAVNGFALGGGCELAMACHLRIASENAVFGQPEVKLGVIPAYGGTQRLCQIIGKTKAFELLMTGESLNAKQALESGLINYLTTPQDLMPKAEELLKKIIKRSPQAVKTVIECVNAFYKNDGGFKKEVDGFAACLGKNDFKEGVAAFLEKREPKFD